jgi:hypothetical protein
MLFMEMPVALPGSFAKENKKLPAAAGEAAILKPDV